MTPLAAPADADPLILAWARAVRHAPLALTPDEPLLVPASAADAARLAGDLARLLDDMETAGIPWERLSETRAGRTTPATTRSRSTS